MTLRTVRDWKIAAVILMVTAGASGGYLIASHAAQAINWIYYGNQLIEVDFDDGSKIQYGYDENGNQISKTSASASGNQFYTISASAGTGGTISPSGSVSVISGGECSFTVMPNTGYDVANVVVDGQSQGAASGYTFTSVAAAH